MIEVVSAPQIGLVATLICDQDVASQQQRDRLVREWARHRLGRPASEIEMERSAVGAPRLAAGGVSFAVSTAHRAGCLLVGMADHPVGVDFETIGAPQEPPWNILAETERQALRGIADPVARHEAFLRTWVVKEALVKARGTGFEHDPSSLAVSWTCDDALAVSEQGRPLCLRFVRTGRVAHGSERFVWACVVL